MTGSFYRNGELLLEHVWTADSLLERMKGLLGRSSLDRGTAIWIRPCNAIHTFLMQFTIDLVFLDNEFRVVKISRDVAPGRCVQGGRGAATVVEIQSGWLPEDSVREGDVLEFKSSAV